MDNNQLLIEQKELPLLTEVRAFPLTRDSLVTENREGRTVLKLKGLYQQANVINANKRMYPNNILSRETLKLQENINNRRLLGEADHPSDGTVHLQNASHLITRLSMEGDSVFGECEILTTPSGKILEEMVKNNVTLGISSRGMGSVIESTEVPGVLSVCEDYEMITFDMVSEPSTPQAYMTLSEARRLYMNSAQQYGINDKDTKKLLVSFIDEVIQAQANILM